MLRKIRVLVVDDSATAREIVSKILESDPEIEVVGKATNGREAISLNNVLDPDIITMDVEMPVVDGLTAVEEIMAYKPRPILMVTNLLPSKVNLAFEAMAVGALDSMPKPSLDDLATLGQATTPKNLARQLIDKTKVLSGVKVVTHFSRRFRKQKDAPPLVQAQEAHALSKPFSYKLVAIGASTGGPKALQAVLNKLPQDFPLPIAIVQHISDGFTQGFVDWLNSVCSIEVLVAQEGARLSPGKVFVAPSRLHMTVNNCRGIELEDSPPLLNQKPAVNVLFSSVAKAYGHHAIGVILTGMGDDGAVGLKEMHDAGAHTIAQSEAGCTIFGMPKVAIELGGAKEVMPLEKIPEKLIELVQR